MDSPEPKEFTTHRAANSVRIDTPRRRPVKALEPSDFDREQWRALVRMVRQYERRFAFRYSRD